MPAVQHPQSAERTKHRKRLQRRTKPDYCYSEKQDQTADVPEYTGPFAEELVFADYWASRNPADDGKLDPTAAEEELIEQYQKRLQPLVVIK